MKTAQNNKKKKIAFIPFDSSDIDPEKLETYKELEEISSLRNGLEKALQEKKKEKEILAKIEKEKKSKMEAPFPEYATLGKEKNIKFKNSDGQEINQIKDKKIKLLKKNEENEDLNVPEVNDDYINDHDINFKEQKNESKIFF